MFLIFWLVRYVAMRIEPSGSRANHIGIGCGNPPGPLETIVIVFLDSMKRRISSSVISICLRRDMAASYSAAMLSIDLTGKRAFVAGIADDWGFGFAIAKRLAEAGATVCAGTWPPAYGIFTKMLERGKIGDSLRMKSGGTLAFERILPLDAEWDTLADVPVEVRENRRYKEHDDFTIQGAADRLVAEFGAKPLDIVIHSIANGTEVKN